MVGQFCRGGVTWSLDLNEGIDFALFLGQYERELVRTYRSLVQPGSVVLDIGANIGAHTLPLAQCVGPTGRIIAIEPTEYAIAKLRANLRLNPELAKVVTPIHAFMAASADDIPDAAIPSSWPLTSDAVMDTALCGSEKSTGTATTNTVDGLVRELGLTRVDWIKIDVDGHEPDVLAGATECIGTFHPRILIELAPYCHSGDPRQFDDIVALFASSGYSFVRLPSRAALPMSADQLRERHIPLNGSINIMAVPAAPDRRS